MTARAFRPPPCWNSTLGRVRGYVFRSPRRRSVHTPAASLTLTRRHLGGVYLLASLQACARLQMAWQSTALTNITRVTMAFLRQDQPFAVERIRLHHPAGDTRPASTVSVTRAFTSHLHQLLKTVTTLQPGTGVRPRLITRLQSLLTMQRFFRQSTAVLLQTRHHVVRTARHWGSSHEFHSSVAWRHLTVRLGGILRSTDFERHSRTLRTTIRLMRETTLRHRDTRHSFAVIQRLAAWGKAAFRTAQVRPPATIVFPARVGAMRAMPLPVARAHRAGRTEVFTPQARPLAGTPANRVTAGTPSIEHMEKTLREALTHTVERTVKQEVAQKLRSESGFSRRLSERVQSDLYNNIILERERLGGRTR
ncbi:MAG: hypothetical protein JST93_01915 [Acidobacteria bacterium]|nr:hypothetical protein [Acidobacteriota bacterium]